METPGDSYMPLINFEFGAVGFELVDQCLLPRFIGIPFRAEKRIPRIDVLKVEFINLLIYRNILDLRLASRIGYGDDRTGGMAYRIAHQSLGNLGAGIDKPQHII